MTPQELKNSILQLAIQGKLVEQCPEEGTGEELYQQIQAEKQQLIKEGKIKKEKPLPEIAEDEVPFDIPESWKWVRLSNVVDVRDGTHDTPKYVSTGVPLVTSKNLVNGGIDFETAKLISFDDSAAINIRSGVDDGDILYAMIGTIGNPVLVKKSREFSIKNMALFKQINSDLFDMSYLLYFLIKAQEDMKKMANASVQSFVSLSVLRNFLFPLPPLAEQKRIVAKIEELLPYIDRYEQAWSKLEAFNKRFPVDMQKSILQAAIQGKLVEQRVEDGTSAELLKEIQTQKQKLIETGVIRKPKKTPEFQESELPFAIPQNWKWVRLIDLCEQISDGTHKTPHYLDSGIPFISVKDISNGFLDFSNTKFISEDEHRSLIERCKPQRDDILICRIGTLGKAIKIDTDAEFSIFVSLGLIKLVSKDIVDYLVVLINSGYGFWWIQKVKVGGGTHTFKINLQDLRMMPVPLPPIAEQRRIVAKVEELLPLCELLK